jgi:hypothetical protein
VVIDRALYLPKDWAADEKRREEAGIPEEITFTTELEQTATMVKNALATALHLDDTERSHLHTLARPCPTPSSSGGAST